MKFPGSVYHGEREDYLAVYFFHHDVFVRLPEEYSGLERVAHFTYNKGKREGGAEVFRLPAGFDVSEICRVKKNFRERQVGYAIKASGVRGESFVSNSAVRKAFQKYNIGGKVVSKFKELSEEVANVFASDVVNFCKENVAKIEGERARIETVKRIVPVTKLEEMTPWKLLRGGKQWFVPDCVYEANFDLGKGCLASWFADEGASFDGETFKGFFFSPAGECDYCYAEPDHKFLPKSVYKFDKAELIRELMGDCCLEFENEKKKLGRPVKILRLGKRVEFWMPFFRDRVVQTLEACCDTGTKCVMPTKFLPYDKEIAELSKRTHSVPLYSVSAFDRMEVGACEQGCDSDFRLEQAVKYREAGVNSNLYLLTVAHAPIGEREKKILAFAKQHKLRVQLLPMRFGTKELAFEATGISWDDLVGNAGQASLLDNFGDYRGSYSFRNGAGLSIKCNCIHPEWKELVGENNGCVRMCHHCDKNTYCGGCFQSKGIITQTKHVEKIKRGARRKKKNYIRAGDGSSTTSQQELSFLPSEN